MRCFAKQVAAATLVTALSGCFANQINAAMDSWRGAHYSQLLMSWGPPQQVYDDGQGGRILVYTQVRQWTTPGQAVTMTSAQAQVYNNLIWGNARSVTEYRPPQTYGYTAWRMFQIDRTGRIYNWSWQGL